MPLNIPKDKEDEWLETDKPMNLVKPFDSKLMEVWRISTLVNSPRNDRPKLIQGESYT
jgi:putative SOS response-associated peptidase YedK